MIDMTASTHKPIIILDQPQLGENIGMVARAMANCNFENLRIITPRDGWPNPAAIKASAGADALLHQAVIYPNLSEAIADCHYVLALTARTRQRNLPRYDLEQAVAEIHAQAHLQDDSGQYLLKTAVLFGAERAGLSNESISKCHAMVHIALNPDFSSLNLSQAVLLFTYLYHRHVPNVSASSPPSSTYETDIKNLPATQAELDNFINRLLQALENSGFFRNPKQKPEIIRNLQCYFTRSSPSQQELNSLHGMIERLQKPIKSSE